MENIALKVSHLKHLKNCTESDNQYIPVLPVRIHGQMNHWIAVKHPSVKSRFET